MGIVCDARNLTRSFHFPKSSINLFERQQKKNLSQPDANISVDFIKIKENAMRALLVRSHRNSCNFNAGGDPHFQSGCHVTAAAAAADFLPRNAYSKIHSSHKFCFNYILRVRWQLGHCSRSDFFYTCNDGNSKVIHPNFHKWKRFQLMLYVQ